MNSPEISSGKDSLFDAGIKSRVPNAKIIKPNDNPFLQLIKFKYPFL